MDDYFCLISGDVLTNVTNIVQLIPCTAADSFFFFIFYFLFYHFILHRLEKRTKPISTPYDAQRWWDSNLRTPTPACKSQLYHCATDADVLPLSVRYQT